MLRVPSGRIVGIPPLGDRSPVRPNRALVPARGSSVRSRPLYARISTLGSAATPRVRFGRSECLASPGNPAPRGSRLGAVRSRIPWLGIRGAGRPRPDSSRDPGHYERAVAAPPAWRTCNSASSRWANTRPATHTRTNCAPGPAAAPSSRLATRAGWRRRSSGWHAAKSDPGEPNRRAHRGRLKSRMPSSGRPRRSRGGGCRRRRAPGEPSGSRAGACAASWPPHATGAAGA
jgi:hypothetical protein